jgi:cytochrome oxidase assembly protein ShyY1
VRFLLSRRGLSLVAFAVLVAAACVALGLWQLDRYEQRLARNAAVASSLQASPAPLAAVVEPGTAAADVPDEAQWRTVVVQGSYDPASVVTLRLRPVDGQSGVHVLTPLVQADGTAVLVDRGFLATGRGTGTVEPPEPPTGTVEVQGRLRLTESGRGSGLDADTDPPSIRFVDLDALRAELGLDLAPVWLERADQAPPEAAALAAVPPPRLSTGTSLIYAVQWFLFGVIAVVGFAVLARRDSRTAAPADAPAS